MNRVAEAPSPRPVEPDAASTQGKPPHLWQFRVSHYNEKVRWALDWKRIPHRRVRLTPGFHLMRVRRLTGQNKVPVLIADGEPLADSTQIIATLERQQPEPPLYPADPEARARALAIEDHYDEQVAPDVRRIFWSCYLPSWGASTRLITDGEPIPFFGDGSSRRDYTYVDDIVTGILGALRCERPYAIYNLGGAASTSLDELVGHLERALGRAAIRKRLPDQPGDVPITYADVSLAERELGYRCSTPLAAGIDKFCAWYLAEKKARRIP